MPQSVSRGPSNKNAPQTFKSVRIEELPGSSILLDALKPLEQELSKRGLTGGCGKHSHPLWFLAETERNVFLWRNGLSLSDQDKFEFWIDIPALIERRKGQVERGLDDPGFGNPFLGGMEIGALEQAGEMQYLEVIHEQLTRIYVQAFELSLITRMVHKELRSEDRPIILLPATRNSKKGR